MPYCRQCGSEVRPADSFCSDCGSEIDPEPRSNRGGVVESGKADGVSGGERTRAHVVTGDGPTAGRVVFFAGVGFVALGAFLPWMTAEAIGTTLSGVERGGVLTLVLGIVAGIVGFLRWDKWARLSVGGLGVLVAMFGLLYVVDPLFGVDAWDVSDPGLVRDAVRPEAGLFLTAFGGVAMVGGPAIDWLS